MLHLTTDTIYSFSFHGVAVIFTLQNHVTSMYSCCGDKVRYTCKQASSFSNEMADYDDITGCSAQGGGEDLIIMANMNGAAAAPAGYAMSPLSETLWRNKTNTDKVGDTSARVTKQSCKESQVHTKGNLQRLQLISDLFYTSFQGFVKNLILGGQLIISPLEQLYVSCL
jgi:hypothetical protein